MKRANFVRFKGFDWDSGNRQKARRHGVEISEIETLFLSPLFVIFDEKHSDDEDRFIAVGETIEGDPIFVCFTFRTIYRETFVRVISARYMHEKEKIFYEKLKKDE